MWTSSHIIQVWYKYIHWTEGRTKGTGTGGRHRVLRRRDWGGWMDGTHGHRSTWTDRTHGHQWTCLDRSSGGQWWIWPGEEGPACGEGGGNSTRRYRRRTSLRNNDPDSDRMARREGLAGIAAAGQVWQVRTSWGHKRLTGKDGSLGSLDGPAPEAGGWWATVLYPVNTYNTQNTC